MIHYQDRIGFVASLQDVEQALIIHRNGRRIADLPAAAGRLDLDLSSLKGRLGRGIDQGPQLLGLRLQFRRVYDRLSFAGGGAAGAERLQSAPKQAGKQ